MNNSLFVILFRGVLGYCPHCGKTRMFKGMYAMHQRCPYCGLPFENKPGDFTGTAYINSVATGFIGVAFGVLVVLFTDISIVTLTIAAIPLLILTAILLHQPIKGTWIALMYYTEAIQPPE